MKKNLQSKPELNGQLGVVSTPKSFKEKEDLKSKGRILVLVNSLSLSLKETNLTVIDCDSKLDWSVSDTYEGPIDMLHIVSKSKIGELDVCNKFVESIQDYLKGNNKKIRFPKIHFQNENQSIEHMILSSLDMHAIHFFALNGIGHHLFLETYQGRARLYQSYVKDPFRRAIKIGFSGNEWVSKEPLPIWPNDLKAAHLKWGGGKELNMSELKELIDLLFDIQAHAEKIASHLFEK